MPSQRRKQLRPYKPLHPNDCTESEEDLKYMRHMIEIDRRSLARLQENEENPTFKGPPLMKAYCARHYKCMEFLLENGARPDGTNSSKYTTMHFALHDNNIIAVQLLFKYGSNPNFNSSGCGSFLSWALGNAEITSILLSHGAFTDCILSSEYDFAYYLSNLSRALRRGHIESAKLLLLYNAITDYRKVPGINPYCLHFNAFPHCVIKENHPKKSVEVQIEMFRMLHEFGVDLYQPNKVGLTVMQVLQFQAIGDEESRVLFEYLRKLLSEPPTLLSLSRIAIKQILGRKLLQKLPIIQDLKLIPLPLVTYLGFPKL